MKSLLERATARPLYSIGIVIAVIAILFLLWWGLSPSAQKNIAPSKPSIIGNQKIINPTKQLEASAPASTVTGTTEDTVHTSSVPPSTPTTTTSAPATSATPSTTAMNAALPKDPTTAAEELDRLKDEQNRLKERKKELAKQLAISNKLIALKDQQLKELGQTAP